MAQLLLPEAVRPHEVEAVTAELVKVRARQFAPQSASGTKKINEIEVMVNILRSFIRPRLQALEIRFVEHRAARGRRRQS